MWPFSRPAPEPVIRRFLPSQAENCARIHAASFQKGWISHDIARLAAEASVIAHVAHAPRGEQVLGFSLARRAAEEAEILTIAVEPSRRAGGIGKALLKAQLQALADSGVREVFLEVDATNHAAMVLYSRFGFSRVGERKGYYARSGEPPATALILRRALP